MLIVGYSVLSFSSVVPAGSNSRAVRAIDAAKAAVSLFATPRAISKDVHCQWTRLVGLLYILPRHNPFSSAMSTP